MRWNSPPDGRARTVADPNHPPGPDYHRGRPDPAEVDRGFHAAANVIHRLLDHVSELDTADLPIVDGKTVRIVSLSEVEEWLLGCETRVRSGEVL
jgi:hypothetical protein